MVIGLLTIDLDLGHCESLKQKRAIVNRVRDRVRQKFNVSVAEVDEHELWNRACLGIAIVTTGRTFANQVLSKVVDFIETLHDYSVEDYSMDFF